MSKLLHVCVDPLCPSQQFFSYVRTISCIPGLNQYLAEDNVPCSRTKHTVETLKPRLQKKALCVNKGNTKNLASVGNMNLL